MKSLAKELFALVNPTKKPSWRLTGSSAFINVPCTLRETLRVDAIFYKILSALQNQHYKKSRTKLRGSILK